jgi:hypothetical protein
MKISLPNGIEAWFDVDDITIHVWGSSWTGREVVTVCQGERKEVISSKRSWRFKTPHAFEHGVAPIRPDRLLPVDGSCG